MTRYQLAKLVQWAGTLESRKRMQKVVFLLQAAGCPLQVDFFLHHYGPYSEELARLTDEMVRLQLLNELEGRAATGQKYSYTLAEKAGQQLAEFDQSSDGREQAKTLDSFADKARSLLKEDLRQLEYAATIVFFWKRSRDWQKATAEAAAFKRTPAVEEALPLAQRAVAA